jgi:hypothetical protein
MKLSKGLLTLCALSVLAAATILGPAASAGANVDRVTGGGQVFTSSTPSSGPGDTIAVEVHATSTAEPNGPASGNLQYVTHGSAATPAHGTVTCLSVSSSTAYFEGTWNSNSGTLSGKEFYVQVKDNGQGGKATNADMIMLAANEGPDNDGTSCQSDSEYATCLYLARGNAQVYDDE